MKTCFFTIWPTHVLNFKMETWIMKKKRILSREQKSELQHFQMTWWLKRLTHKGSVKKKKEPRSKKSFLKESIRLRGLKFGFNLVFVFILSGDAKKLPLLVNFQNKKKNKMIPLLFACLNYFADVMNLLFFLFAYISLSLITLQSYLDFLLNA